MLIFCPPGRGPEPIRMHWPIWPCDSTCTHLTLCLSSNTRSLSTFPLVSRSSGARLRELGSRLIRNTLCLFTSETKAHHPQTPTRNHRPSKYTVLTNSLIPVLPRPSSLMSASGGMRCVSRDLNLIPRHRINIQQATLHDPRGSH